MSSFPAALDDLMGNQPNVDGVTVYEAAWVNNIQDAVDNLQEKVGIDGSTVVTSLDFALKKAYVKVSDQKTDAHGGTSLNTSWQTRDLNTEDNDAGSLCTLSGNQITLVAGTYRCQIQSVAYGTQLSVLRLRNVTASTTLVLGLIEYVNYGNRPGVSGEFSVAAGQALEVQMYTQLAVANVGLGYKLFTDSTPNIYTVAEFWKIS